PHDSRFPITTPETDHDQQNPTQLSRLPPPKPSRAQELLDGSVRGPVQATPYGVYQVIGFSANGGVWLEARGQALRNPWRARLSAHFEADGFRARLVGRVGIGALGKAAVVAWTAIMLFFWLVGTSIGVASRSVEQVAASTGCAVLGLSIVHGFVVAAGREVPPSNRTP
ncbi:hypothetical protein, partial [Actinoplanes subtropicus]|uniref:hypothetical protein n=1 Tax=Actinoplanes subtropicus TaxID=543632 RepID=UPI001B807810